jgi:maleate isomerase
VIASVREAIRMKGAGRVGVITPYIDALNQKIRDSLIADGIEVAGIRGLGISDNFEIASVTPEEIVEFARSSFGGASIDLLFASCTNFHAMDAVEELERKLGVPVVTSNQATFEAVVRAVGPDEAEIAAG